MKPSTDEEGTWRWSTSKVQKNLDKLIAKKVIRAGVEVWDVFQKDYVNDSNGDQRGTKAKTIWDEKEFNYQNGTNEVKELFDGKEVFDFPKPVSLIKRMLELASDEQAIVLDFFPGSCTTGHAVLELNRDDGGTRRFICVQLPEPCEESSTAFKAGFKNIAEIGKERLRRAGKKVRKENPMFAGDLGFRFFKLASSNIRAWEPDRENLPRTLQEHAEHLKAERTEQDILFELLLKLGLDLTVPIEQKSIAGKAVHSIGAGTLLVCLAPQITREEIEPLALGIVAWHKQMAPMGETSVVFRDSAFADDVAKTNLTAMLQQHGLENVRSL
jgi:adenine-specific DNA-methyltransferase